MPLAGLLAAGLSLAGLLSALGFGLAGLVVRPDAGADTDPGESRAGDNGAGDDGVADEGAADDGAGGIGEGGAEGDDDGVRGRTGPFPLPLGGVPLEFNAVSPLWRHHRLPAP